MTALRGSLSRETLRFSAERGWCWEAGADIRIHAWHNRSDSWARMIYVLVAAKPVKIDGKELGDVKLNKE